MPYPYFAETIWRDEFNTLENWYDNKADASFNALIMLGKTKNTAVIQQKGNGNWGKVAFVVQNVDLDKFNILRLKVNKVDKNGDYRVLVTSLDWNDSFTIIDRGNGKGTYEGNIKTVTGWSGKKTFNVVIVVEGKDKSLELNWIEITDNQISK